MLDDNPFERTHKYAEIRKLELVQAQISKMEAETNPPTFVLHSYMDFVCRALIDKSQTDCGDLLNAGQRMAEKSALEFQSSVHVHVDSSYSAAQSHSIEHKKSTL